MTSVEVGSLEAAALKRKERLAALRASKDKKKGGRENEKDDNSELPK